MKHLDHCSDEVLIEQYAAGCDEAFDVLLRRHQEKLYTYILKQVRDAGKADDLFQETFVKVIMTLREGNYHENGKFSNWLIRIARNLMIDHFRFGRNYTYLYDEEAEKAMSNCAACMATNRENEMVYEQVLLDVRELMDQLPIQQREVVRLRYYENRSFKEISDLTGVSINTALGRMRYAILNMRRLADEHHITLAIS